MKGYLLTRYGSKGMSMRDVPKPTPSAGEVLIRVAAAGLNPVDSAVRKGSMRFVWRFDLPFVLGSELSGVVDEVGPGVTRVAVGDRVFTRLDKLKLGAYAEYCVVDQSLVAKMPDLISFEDAAGLPLAGLTALQGLELLTVTNGDRVFISKGAGGVGTLAIQIAVQLGASVATTASASSGPLVRSLGAESIVDYRRDKFADVLSDYDGAVDASGGRDLLDALSILKPGGRAVSIASLDPVTAREDLAMGRVLVAGVWVYNTRVRRAASRRGIQYRSYMMRPSGDGLDVLAGMYEGGRLKPVTDRIFAFDQLPEAFAYLDQGHAKGKVVVRL